MKLVTVKVLTDTVIDTHTYVKGDEVNNVPVKLADKLVRAGRVELVTEKTSEGSTLDVFQEPGDEKTNELGVSFDDCAKNDASGKPVNLETAVVPRPGKSNGKPKPPTVE